MIRVRERAARSAANSLDVSAQAALQTGSIR
jgi:hypothetical protein